MGMLQDIGADPLCNIAAFALGADIVALITTGRCVHKDTGSPLNAHHHFTNSILDLTHAHHTN